MRRALLVLGLGVLACLPASAAVAGPLTVTAPTDVSIPTPFPPGCGGPTEGAIAGVNFNFPNSEVEPWLAVSPTNPNDVAGFWQQDRWSDGGAHGLVAAVSHNGGHTQADFAYSWPHFSICAGGTAANGGNYGRSSDPWVSWAPNGDLWSISLSVDRTTTRNAVLVSKMAAGSSTWNEPTTVRFDSSEKTGIPLGNNFNDKESLTADRTDPSGNLVYAVWDRIVAPSSRAAAAAFEHNKFAFRGPTWFARTTEGAAANPKWETAHPIYDPGEQNQTISNQIVVLPDGTLVDGFLLIKSHQNNKGTRGFSAAVIRSTDKGVSWSGPVIASHVDAIGETDPEPINCRPYITGNPPCTIVRSDGVIVDLAVDYSSGPNRGVRRRRAQLARSGQGQPDAYRHVHRSGLRAGGARQLKRGCCGELLRLPERRVGRPQAHHRPLDRQLGRRRGELDRGPSRRPVRHAPGALRAWVLRGRLPGPRLAGHGLPAAVHAGEPRLGHGIPEPEPDRRVHQQRGLISSRRS
jgi:hypothetical protein